MNGYSPNDTKETYAPLTSNLLARKGAALPAFDSDAYAEVMTGNEFNAPLSPIFTKDKTAQAQKAQAIAAPPARPPARQASHKSVPRSRVPARPFSAVAAGKDHAAVTFRIDREEFGRLRRAAKELDMSAHRILLDAIECYLDANEVQPVKNEQWVNDARVNAVGGEVEQS